MLAVGLASLWLLATPIIADAIARLSEHYPALELAQATRAQAIVILGGGGQRSYAPEYAGPAADYGLLERLSYGAFVARHTGLPILVSGAPSEAVAMKTSLARDFGVEARWMDGQSRDTYENSRFSAKILAKAEITRIVLVTSSAHLWRAAQEFKSVGLEVIPAPAGVWGPREAGALRFIPSPAGLMRSNAAIYEMLGEPMRRVQAALGLRERLDTRVSGAR
ncbi:MAG: YdcF family protein [Steroidobacteraceae bacterium]